MKQIFITISIFYLLSGIIFGQVKDSTLSLIFRSKINWVRGNQKQALHKDMARVSAN